MDTFQTILRLTDAAIPAILASQQIDQTHRDYNGQIVAGKGYSEPIISGNAAATLIAAYCCPQSVYYHNDILLNSAINDLSFLLSRCHEDGSIDLMETNFHDCTCSAFAVRTLAYTYRLLEHDAKTVNEKKAKFLVLEFIERSAQAMMTGGFHTPNHRWVIASALSLCSNILQEPAFADMARVYLSEDIDQNEEGDYTERSMAIYDVVCNESMIILAEELNMPELYTHVEHNVTKNLYYIEPDFSGLTMASTRQDYGKSTPVVNYLFTSLMLYKHNGNNTALYLSHELLKQMNDLALMAGPPLLITKNLYHQNLLTRFLLEPSLCMPLPSERTPAMRYEKSFDLAGIVRYRYDQFTLSLIRDNPSFMKIQNGHLKAYLKLTGSFFGRGRMQAQSITKIDGGYRMTYQTEWGYFRPIKDLHNKCIEEFDRNKRERANMQSLRFQIDILPAETGATLRISSEGTANIPVKLEFIFEEGGMLYTAHTTQPGIAGGYSIIGEKFTYDRYGEKLIVEGGFNLHEYAPEMRGSDPMPPENYCVFFTGFTPIDTEITLTAPPLY